MPKVIALLPAPISPRYQPGEYTELGLRSYISKAHRLCIPAYQNLSSLHLQLLRVFEL